MTCYQLSLLRGATKCFPYAEPTLWLTRLYAEAYAVKKLTILTVLRRLTPLWHTLRHLTLELTRSSIFLQTLMRTKKQQHKFEKTFILQWLRSEKLTPNERSHPRRRKTARRPQDKFHASKWMRRP